MALLMMSRKKTFSDHNEILDDVLEDKTNRAGHPVDLVHLSRQTLGERSLEKEILSLFLKQSELYLERLENAQDEQERYMAAHTILGSARGIGAWKVAAAARFIEKQASQPGDTRVIRQAILEVNDYITGLFGDDDAHQTVLS